MWPRPTPTNIRTSIRRVGDELRDQRPQWFTTGALHPNCKLCIVLGVTEESVDPHNRHSMVLVGDGHHGLQIVATCRSCTTTLPRSLRSVCSKDVRVPVVEPARPEGKGFAIGAGRLGPPRTPLHAHHRPVRAGARTDVRARAGAQSIWQAT